MWKNLRNYSVRGIFYTRFLTFAPLPAFQGRGRGVFSFYSDVLRLRGLPPPTPRPGRCAFHWSMVSSRQPLALPTTTSGSGSL
nr:MAG TPA: hypothetical protein [Caudoviricetes sp.]